MPLYALDEASPQLAVINTYASGGGSAGPQGGQDLVGTELGSRREAHLATAFSSSNQFRATVIGPASGADIGR